jgi:branched-chain amino acid transport system substrate-binding protein
MIAPSLRELLTVRDLTVRFGGIVALDAVSFALSVYGYLVSQTLVHVLKQAGNDLSRPNIMKQAASIKDLSLPLLLPGIKINTSATDFYPIEQEQLIRFDGEKWIRFGEVYDASKK